VVLSTKEVNDPLERVRNPVHRMCLTVIYACGLRLSEGIHLKVEDIDSKRMLVAVRNGKGGKDRYVPLPEPTLAHLALPSPKGRTSPRQLLAAKDLQGGGPPKRHRQERLGP
jgi:site-specific recombinase XerD